MSRDTKPLGLPSLIGDLFTRSELQIDNVFASLWSKLHMATLLHRAGLHKRSGVAVTQVVYLLLLWVWLKLIRLACFPANPCKVSPMPGKRLCMTILSGRMSIGDAYTTRLHDKL